MENFPSITSQTQQKGSHNKRIFFYTFLIKEVYYKFEIFISDYQRVLIYELKLAYDPMNIIIDFDTHFIVFKLQT